MTKAHIIGLVLCLLVAGGMAAGCSSPLSPTESPPPTQSSPLQVQSPIATQASGAATVPVEVPSEAPVPEEGQASISGVLYTFSGNGPIPGTIFYLTPARGETNQEPPAVFVGPREEEGDVQGMSDPKGQIALNNVPPGNYYLVVWAPYNWIMAVESDTDPTFRLITLEPDQRETLGMIYLAWP
jgi:hypothetical protein